MKLKIFVSKELLAQPNYRAFLIYILQEQNSTQKINFSELSRKAEFSSRSYLKEVLQGKKNISPKSIHNIKKAFHLHGLLGTYFDLLVAASNQKIFDKKNNESLHTHLVIQARLNKLRLRLLQQIENPHSRRIVDLKKLDSLYLNRHSPEVYASLGTLEKGASLTEILTRSGLASELVRPILAHFINLNVIEFRDDRYYAITSNLDIFNLSNSITFSRIFNQAAIILSQKAEGMEKSETELFLHSVFTIQKHRTSEVRARFKKLIMDFIDEEQDDSGDQLAKLTLGFYS